MSANGSHFHDRLIQTRLEAGHPPENMAILLGILPEEYDALEGGKYPDDETLKRICNLMEWNYFDTKRLIVNEMISPNHKGAAPGTLKASPLAQTGKEGNRGPASPFPVSSSSSRRSIGERMKAARETHDHPPEVVALLLATDIDTYLAVERGEKMPSMEMLRRISLAFEWNFNDLLDMLRTDQALRMPHRMAGPLPSGGGLHQQKFKQLLTDLERQFFTLRPEDQEHTLVQMELVRDTMRRLAKPPGK
ncbi:MAG: helix-turn-helix domain-containing protein [Deltaproteobacteria bacterium]|nr:helix-turn-helix domain-containing protein [Deltaproteobacteria bacterium]